MMRSSSPSRTSSSSSSASTAFASFGSPNTVIFDIKHVLPKEASNGRL